MQWLTGLLYMHVICSTCSTHAALPHACSCCVVLNHCVAKLQLYHFCIGVSCGQPGVPSNGRVNTTDGVLFGDVVRYSCDAGYMVSGLAERTCQAEKRWSGSVPTCEREISIHCDCTYFRFVCVTACMFNVVIACVHTLSEPVVNMPGRWTVKWNEQTCKSEPLELMCMCILFRDLLW